MPERKQKITYSVDPGLRGINVGTTAICPVGEEGVPQGRCARAKDGRRASADASARRQRVAI